MSMPGFVVYFPPFQREGDGCLWMLPGPATRHATLTHKHSQDVFSTTCLLEAWSEGVSKARSPLSSGGLSRRAWTEGCGFAGLGECRGNGALPAGAGAEAAAE